MKLPSKCKELLSIDGYYADAISFSIRWEGRNSGDFALERRSAIAVASIL